MEAQTQVHWRHWNEELVDKEDQHIPYYAGTTFLKTQVSEKDTFSPQAAMFLGMELKFVNLEVDLTQIRFSMIQLSGYVPAETRPYFVDERGQMILLSGFPPPEPPFDHVGDPVIVPQGQESEDVAKTYGWVEWGSFYWNDLTYVVETPDANRFFVGTGANATQRRWNRTQNWSTTWNGAGGSSVPGSSDVAYFTSGGGNCTVDLTVVTVQAIYTSDGGGHNYAGTFDTNGVPIHLSSLLSHTNGTIRNAGVFQVDGNFTMSATWTNVGGSIRIGASSTWNATLTTSYFRFGIPGATITFTTGNTITILSEFNVGGVTANHAVFTCAGNYTFDFDAGITTRACVDMNIDHMQLGAGDTLVAFDSTNNLNNDADITFATEQYVAQATGDWNTDATWASIGLTHPGAGNTWNIPAAYTVSVKGNCACGQGFVGGTLSFNGQTNTVVALLAADVDASIQVLNGGVVSTTSCGTTGYAKITGAEIKTIGTGDIQFGAYWHIDSVCLCSRFVLDNGEKITLDGDCDNDLGFQLDAGSIFVDGGHIWTITTGTAIFNGTYTATGTVKCLGDHIMSGSGMTFNIVQCGASPGAITYTNDVTIADTMSISAGDTVTLDCASNSVSLIFTKTTANPTLTITDNNALRAVNTTSANFAGITGNATKDVQILTGTVYFDYEANYWKVGHTDIQVTQTTGVGTNVVTITIITNTNLQTDAFTITVGDTLTHEATSTLTCDGTLTSGGTWTPLATTTLTVNSGATNLNITAGTFGANVAYVADINTSLLTSGGTLNLSSGTGATAWTFSGSTWDQTGCTINGNTGLITWDRAGTSALNSNSGNFYNINVLVGCTLNKNGYSLVIVNTSQIDGILNANSVGTLNMAGSLLASTGTISAPPAGTFFYFGGSSWTNPTVFTHNSGVISLNRGGTTSLASDANSFYTATVGNGTTLAISTYTMSCAGAMTVGAGASGVVTFSTGTLNVTGTLTHQTGSTFGSATAYNLNCDGDQTLVTTAIYNSPTNAGTHYVAGSLSGNTSMAWNQNGATTILDGVNQGLSGFTPNDGTRVLGNLEIRTSGLLTISGASVKIGYNQNVVLTFNMTGAITGTILALKSTNANQVVCTSMPTNWNGCKFFFETFGNFNIPTSTWTNAGDFYIYSIGGPFVATLTGNVVVTGNGNNAVYGGSTTFTLAISTYTLDFSGSTGNFDCGITAFTCSITITTGTIKIGGTLKNNGDSNFTFGSVTDYTLDLNGPMNWTTGICNLPAGTNATFSGSSWTQGAVGTVVANGGKITWDRAGIQTLNSASQSFYQLRINAGATLDTASYAITTAAQMFVYGTLTCNASTCSFASGLAVSGLDVEAGGIFTGGNGAHTIGAMYFSGAGGSVTLTSNTTTLNSENLMAISFYNFTGTFAHGGGTVAFVRAGSQRIGDSLGTTRTFNIWTVNNAACTVRCYNAAYGFALILAGAMNITAGTFDTSEPGGTSYALTANSATVTVSNGGTLNCNNSAITFNWSGGVSLSVSGIFNGGSGAHSMGLFSIGATATATLTSGTTTIISGNPGFGINAGATFDDGNGTLLFNAGMTQTFNLGGIDRTFYNVTVNAASCVMRQSTGSNANLTIAHDLTVTAGTFNTAEVGGTSRDLIVSNATVVRGALTCNASSVSLGSGITAYYGLSLIGAAATFNGGTGPHTIGSIIVNATTSCTLTSNTTTINSWTLDGSKYALIISGTATLFAHNSGTIHFDNSGANNANITDYKVGSPLNNVIVDYNAQSLIWTDTNYIAGTLNITTGTLSITNLVVFSVTGAATVSGVFTLNNTTIGLGSLTTTAAGVVNGNTASITMAGAWDTSAAVGCWVCNTSTVIFSASTSVAINGTNGFYNLTINASYTITQSTNIISSNLTTLNSGVTMTMGGNLTTLAMTVSGTLANPVAMTSSVLGTIRGVIVQTGNKNMTYTTLTNAYLDLSQGGTQTITNLTVTYANAGDGVNYAGVVMRSITSGTYTDWDIYQSTYGIAFITSACTVTLTNLMIRECALGTGGGSMVYSAGGSIYLSNHAHVITLVNSTKMDYEHIIFGGALGTITTVENVQMISCLGDSLTQGATAHKRFWNAIAANDPILSSYPAQLTLALANYFGLNEGEGSNTIPQVIARVSGAIKQSPGGIIVWIGINDVAGGRTLAQMQGDYATLFTSIQNAGLGNFFVCALAPTTTVAWNTVSLTVNAWLATQAATYGYTFISETWDDLVSGGILNPIYNAGDGTHLNLAGYTLVASDIATYIPGIGAPTIGRYLDATVQVKYDDTNNVVMISMSGSRALSTIPVAYRPVAGDALNIYGAYTLTWDIAGSLSLGAVNLINSNLTVNADAGQTITMSSLNVHSGTTLNTSRNITVTNATSVSGTFTPNTTSLIFNGAVTVNAGGVFGSVAAYSMDCASSFTMVGASTFNSATAGGAMSVAGDLVGSVSMTWNQGGVTTVLDGVNQGLTGFSSTGSSTKVLGNLSIQTSTALTVIGLNRIGNSATGQDEFLTFNMTGALVDGGGGTLRIYSTNVNFIACTSMPTSWGGVGFGVGAFADHNLPAATYTNIGTVIFASGGMTRTYALTGNITMTGTSTIDIASNGAWYTNFNISSYTFDCSNVTGIFTCGAANRGGSISLTWGTIKIGGDLTNTGDANFTFGSNSGYTWTQTGSLNWTVGTLQMPNGSGTGSFAGASWNQGAATVNSNFGTLDWNRVGVQSLASNATNFYACTTGGAGTTLNTVTFDFTLADAMTININDTLNCGSSTCVFAPAKTNGAAINIGGTFTGGSGAHTCGPMYCNIPTAVITLTSNTTTFSGHRVTDNYAIWINQNVSIDANTGTALFDYAGLQVLKSVVDQTLYRIVVNKGAGNTLKYGNALGFSLTIANTFTITTGTFDTREVTSGVSRNLTVASTSSISDTLLTNASTATFQNNVTINAGGIVDFGGNGQVICGTGALAITIANSGTVRFSANTVNHAYIRGFDNAHKVICTGSNWSWDYGGAGSFVDIKWIDIRILTIGGTGGAGTTIEALGDSNIQAMSITAADTFKCVTANTTLTGDSTKIMFSVDGTLQLAGTAGNPVIVTGHKYLDANSGAGVFINWQYTNFICANVAGAYPALFQVDTNIPTISNCNFTAGALSNGTQFEIGLRMTLSTCTFAGGSGADQYSQNLYLWDDGELQMTGSTFTTVGLDGTWDAVAMLISKNHAGTDTWRYYGTFDASDPDAGYQASNWVAASDIATINADALGLLFSTAIFLDQNATTCGDLSIGAASLLTINNGINFTGTGDAAVDGTLTGSNQNHTFRSMTIGAAGTYTATSATTYITSATGANVAWDNENVFTHSNGTVIFQGHLSPFIIMGDNIWHIIEIVVSDGPTYLFEGNHTQTVDHYCRMNGTFADLLVLDSTDANDWFLTLNVGCLQDFAFLDVHDSDASGGLQCVGAFSTDGGGNHNWLFGMAGVFIWDGGGGDNLATTGPNWMGDVAPGPANSFMFTAASSKDCTWDIANTGGHGVVDNNYLGEITLNNDVIYSSWNQDGGTITLDSNTMELNGNLSLTNGVMDPTGPSVIKLNFDMTVSGGTVGAAAAWTLSIANGGARTTFINYTAGTFDNSLATLLVTNLSQGLMNSVPEFASYTFTGPAGWLVSWTHNGVAGDIHYWGIMNTSDSNAGYQAVDWIATDHITLRHPDAYTLHITTQITMDETPVEKPELIIKRPNTILFYAPNSVAA